MEDYNSIFNNIDIYDVNEKLDYKSAFLAALLAGSSPMKTDAIQSLKQKPSISQSENISIKKYNPAEVRNIIARTLWAEAKGEGEDGMRAVASVIYNRAGGNYSRFVEVIKKRKQFSCWNAMTEKDWKEFKIKENKGAAWELCKKIAEEMIRGDFTTTTKANHYYNPYKCTPNWSKTKEGKLRPKEEIGNHYFMVI